MNGPLDVGALVRPDRYPMSSKYDPAWLLEMNMGPNPLWLLENLLGDLDLQPGMTVLDLGPGRGATSVFLVKELGVEVVAADLWVEPAAIAQVFAEEGVGDRAQPVQADARALPFPPDHFDAIVSIDAFEYFGTDDTYFPYLAGFVKPGGTISMAAPALRREIRELGAVPSHVERCVGHEALAWHTAEWWRVHWELTGLATVTSARLQNDGWGDWLSWERAALAFGNGDQAVVDMLEADGGELLTFALVTAQRN